MIRIYGIKNCDTMQKAIKWLVANNIEFEFYNYKESGIDKATLTRWLKFLPLEELVNKKGTTYKALTEEEKLQATEKAGAIALMMLHTSIIKRPVWDFGNDVYSLGWDEAAISKMVKGA